jgi:hypothetical protein
MEYLLYLILILLGLINGNNTTNPVNGDSTTNARIIIIDTDDGPP